MKLGLKPLAVIVAVALTWGTIAIAIAHHEGATGSESGSGGGSSTLLIVIGGVIAVGIVAFIMFQIWDRNRSSGKKFHRGRRRKA